MDLLYFLKARIFITSLLSQRLCCVSAYHFLNRGRSMFAKAFIVFIIQARFSSSDSILHS